MNVWKLIAPASVVKSEEEIPEPQEGELKIRITSVLVDKFDSMIVSGDVKAGYPLVLGRFAIGRVASDNSELFPKGTRVLLRTFRKERDTGVEKVDFSADPESVRGKTVNGFLSDFVVIPEDEVTAIPNSVDDEEALLAETVALAKSAIGALDVQKGSHVAVFGGDLLGLIVCQLLIYQQASPILIENNETKLDEAKQAGIYYTLGADDSLVENLAKITGGHMADGAIFITSSGSQERSLPFKVCGRGASVVYAGFYKFDGNVNLELALKKQITVLGRTSGEDEVPTAINLLANKAVNFSFLDMNSSDADGAEAALSPAEDSTDQSENPTVIHLY